MKEATRRLVDTIIKTLTITIYYWFARKAVSIWEAFQTKAFWLDMISLLCILLFLYAGGIKLLEYQKFIVQLDQSPMLKGLTGFIAWFIPTVELIISVTMSVGMLHSARLFRWSLLAFLALMTLFTFYILAILFISPSIPCSCGGVIGEIGGWWGHLAFNLIFVGSSAYVLLAQEAAAPIPVLGKLYAITAVALIPFFTVGYLALRVDRKPGHRFAGFERKLPINLHEAVAIMELNSNSYYLAGTDDDHLYLAHPSAIGQLLQIRNDLLDSTYIPLSLPPLTYISVTTSVQPPYFYLSDGNSGWVYRGLLRDRMALPYLNGSRFVHAVPTSGSIVGFYGMQGMKNALGYYTSADTAINYRDGQLIEQGGEGMFSTDGRLVYDKRHGRFVFVYHYRNEYLVLDSQMNVQHTGHTIDTITRAKLKIGHNRSDGQYVLQESLMVNQLAAVSDNKLYVKSMLLAGNEDEGMYDRHTVLDVYDLDKQAYLHSLYLPDRRGHTVRALTITKNGHIAVLQGRELVMYPFNKISLRNDTGKRKPNTCLKRSRQHYINHLTKLITL
ncbi:MauE/DoxX family redox-associated membrane protein [Parapedobacter sp. 2B3]|uniref:MauE/DoxX family redox-associated membrane protein n=1 Tax=Parapedobacter sp. 2B3 TaxID=3342381 RepID=UPI0035B65847